MLPISLRPNGRRAVIVGGGDVAARKAQSLAGAGFPLFVVAQRIGGRLRSFLAIHGGACAERAYETADLSNAALVIAATDDFELNARIVADARASHVLVCDATQSERGDFTMTATTRIGGLTISVDSGGNAPAFSARVAQEIAETFGPEYGKAERTLARMRTYVKDAFPAHERGPILRALAERPVAELAAMQEATLVCATRRSALATIQSRTIAALVAHRGIATEMLGITTHGDRHREDRIDRLGEVNVFVKELERALRDRRADYAVHSCKDLPSALPEDMRIAAISRREDPRDAFCSERYASFDSLPAGAVVGTSSPRRRTQLAALRPDLRYETLRGNVDTRLRKLAAGEYDAIVLAMAGLARLGVRAAHIVPFPVERVVPAVGQGALAVEVRAGAQSLCNILYAAVNDPMSELCVECERAALREMRAGCSAPIGIHAILMGSAIVVHGAYASDHGMARARLERSVSTMEEARALGIELAGALR
ncbi:MAG TPA: hydroxymethylbilane synthase [Candidatus Cybelea sp.]|jgi:hydroxymethylbilane synthase|nr:hydroxymethylbilane synthase [Candidatus Cybelea sp.]